MAINFSTINLEVIDINTNAAPDIFINQKASPSANVFWRT